MRRFLVENSIISELEKVDDKEFHFYQNPDGTLFYFDGTQLYKIKQDTSQKIKEKKLTIEFPSTESTEARKARLKRIKTALKGDELYNKLETERLFRGDTEAGKWTNTKSVISISKKQQLRESISDFIKSEYGGKMHFGYGKDSPMSVDPKILKKVRKRSYELDVPTVSVYFDRSGSWDTTYTNKFAEEILNILSEFDIDDPNCEEPLIRVDVYYFAINVWKDEQKALAEVNNSGEPIIQHMIENQPDNIIIMTDDHLSEPDDGYKQPDGKDTYMKSKYVAPGAVWAIFVNSEADTLIKGYGSEEWHLYGSALTKVFSFMRGEE